MSELICFRPGEIEGAMAERQAVGGSLGLLARRDLERYYALLRDELKRVALTEAEASLVVDALNGTITEPHNYLLTWAEIDNAIRHDHLDRKWQVDGTALVEKLRQLTPGQLMALRDAIERVWLDPDPRDEALRRVGLVA